MGQLGAAIKYCKGQHLINVSGFNFAKFFAASRLICFCCGGSPCRNGPAGCSNKVLQGATFGKLLGKSVCQSVSPLWKGSIGSVEGFSKCSGIKEYPRVFPGTSGKHVFHQHQRADLVCVSATFAAIVCSGGQHPDRL
jgi:hypothetical protein